MPINEKLADELYRSVFGDAWHGASLKIILDEVTFKQAFNRPTKSTHSIVELTLHIDAWTQEVLSRLNGNVHNEPLNGDWQDPKEISEKYWAELKQQLYNNTNKLIAALKNISTEKLSKIVGTERNAAAGTGYTHEVMIFGLLQHTAYHSGQISLLKK